MTFIQSRIIALSSLSLATLAVIGCQNSTVDGPSSKSVKGKLVFELPEYIAVQNIEIHASENFGSEVDPRIRARFSADAKLSEPLYELVANYSNTDVIRIKAKKDTPLKISGKYSATLQGEAWRVNFEDLDAAPSPEGRKLSNWSVGSYVIAGTSEEKALVAKDRAATAKREADRKAAAEKIEANRKAAEEKRIKDAAERKRLALIEKQKTEALEARLAKERETTRKAASAKQTAVESSFRRTVSGTWNPVGSMIDRDGNVYANGRDKVAISLRFTIPETQYNKFVVPLTVYASEYPSAQFTTDATVTLDANSNKISLSFPGRKKVEMACLTKPGRECYYYESLGSPWSGIVKNNEVKLIGGRNRNITLRKS